MLVTTGTANKLIADTWFARADFGNDNPDIMEGLTRGIFDAMQDLKVQENKQKVSKLKGQMMEAKNNEQYRAFQHEIDYAGQETRKAEDRILELMGEAEPLEAAGELARILLTMRGQRDIGDAGVLAGEGPLGLPMPRRIDDR